MLTEFKSLSDDSRLWVYGSETELTKEQQGVIANKLSEFLKTWEYHQKELTASFNIFENRFVVIALDDSIYGVGGCSMDGLQRLIQELEQELNISLMNRLNVFCKIEDAIVCVPSFKLGSIANSDTLFYDLTVLKKAELTIWLKPISEGWCKTFL